MSSVQIFLRFLDYEMQNSNECKRNFVAVYDGSSSVEHLKNKFCSTVANDVMLLNSLGVIRMWADETSRRSRFRILFTTFHERESFSQVFFNITHFCSTYSVLSSIDVVIYPLSIYFFALYLDYYILAALSHFNRYCLFAFQLHVQATHSFAIATCV